MAALDLLFLDYQTQRPYAARSLTQDSIGGTEATVVRVAEALGRELRVGVAQAARESDEQGVSQAAYLSMATARLLTGAQAPGAVVLVRKFEEIGSVARTYGGSRLLFWAHDLRRIRRVRQYRRALAGGGFQVVTVSHFLQELAEAALEGRWYERPLDRWRHAPDVTVRTVYNAIDEDLLPDHTPTDPTKLLFLSAPAKGLDEVISRFQEVRREYPDLTLHIAHPGYIDFNRYRRFDARRLSLPGQVVLGALSHPQIVQHLREAFCVFYPQTTKAETFGLIYAEANAVGTPVLAHDFGAAREVLSDPGQLVNGRNASEILTRLRAWREQGRPQVSCRPEFRTGAVVGAWHRLLDERVGGPA